MNEKPKKIEFQILKKDPETHGGFGAGTLSLATVSPIIIDVEAQEAVVDIGAMHAKSDVEKGIKFLTEPSLVPNAKVYWLVWVTIGDNPNGKYYYGVTACEMRVDREIKRGYKSLPIHVNRMDKSMKGHILLDEMDSSSRNVLRNFLESYQPATWENTPKETNERI